MDGKNSTIWVFIREWLAPVGVASVFALALAATLEFIDGTERHPGTSHTGSHTGSHAGSHAGRHAMPRGRVANSAPRFLVAIPRSGTEVVVREVSTGVTAGIARLAGHRFQQVAAAGDGTYVVAGCRGGRVSFDRLRLNAKGAPAEFAPLAHAGLSGVWTKWSDLAVSGDRIAYVTSLRGLARIQIVSIATGARQTWVSKVTGRVGSLSWAGPKLSFVWAPLRTGRTGKRQLRLLDTIGPGGDLSAARTLLTLPADTDVAVLSQDGTKVLTGVTESDGVEVAEFSAATRERTRVLWQRRTAGPERLARLKPDPSGAHLLATTTDGRLVTDPAQDLPAQPAGDLDVAW
jgi:hypothetical protein